MLILAFWHSNVTNLCAFFLQIRGLFYRTWCPSCHDEEASWYDAKLLLAGYSFLSFHRATMKQHRVLPVIGKLFHRRADMEIVPSVSYTLS
ncbi:hypothetical protein A2U01_0016151, partial [Trifolium medium]|nr:hypothetical protein [Trifolium medium]